MRESIAEIISEIKILAKKYKDLTGKPLGVTGEIGEIYAAQILDLELSDARQPGYDATKGENGEEIKYQIKSRCLKNQKITGRVGAIRFKHEWHFVLLVLLDEDYEVTSIYQANRGVLAEEMSKPGSIARTIRGQLSIRKFMSVGEKIWER